MLEVAPGITFDEATHSYTLDGLPAPGVTSPLDMFYDFRFVKEVDLEKARDKGKKVHKTIELFEAGTLDRKSLDPVLERHLHWWEKFKADFGFLPAGFEVFVASRKRRFCGQMDCHGILLPMDQRPEEELLLDVKTGVPYAPHSLQTAGYKIAAVEQGILGKDAKRASLYLDEEGYQIKWHTSPMDELAFLSALTIHHWRQHGSH